MLVDKYSVRIPEGKEDSSAYVALCHKDNFSLVLRNNNNVSCDAKVEFQGKNQGTWRINSKGSIRIERPGHDTGLFTFYKLDSQEAIAIGLTNDDPNLGLIKVTFTPEKERIQWEEFTKSSLEPISKGLSYEAGGIGLSGESRQQFGTAGTIELDYDKSVVIHLRVVESGVNVPRPLTSYSNPVPPRIY